MYDIKCQGMEGQCPACPIGRAVAELNVHEVRVNCLLSYQFSFKKSNAAEIGNPNSESTDSLAITSNKQNHLSLSVNARLRSGALSREAQFSHYLWVPR